MRKDNRDDALLHTQIDIDKEKIDKARLLSDAINNNISSFSPEMSFEKLVNNYSSAKKLFGETLIRELTGYDPGFVEKNINIPEFKRELKERIKHNIEQLKKEGFLDKEGIITDQGYDYAALAMLAEELDDLEGKGLLGENEGKEKAMYGERQDSRNYRHGDRFKDISLKQTIKKALRRGHSNIHKTDLVTSERKSKGKIEIIYALDSSGSMKGEKIKVAKKSGIALIYKAITNNDKAGLIIFGSKITKAIPPSKDFYAILKEFSRIKTSGETDIALCIENAIKMFSNATKTKHIILLTDAMQTLGKKPEKEVLEKVSDAANQGITITVIGIGLNKQGENLAKKIADISKGSMYKVKSLENINQIVIEDYYKTRHFN